MCDDDVLAPVIFLQIKALDLSDAFDALLLPSFAWVSNQLAKFHGAYFLKIEPIKTRIILQMSNTCLRTSLHHNEWAYFVVKPSLELLKLSNIKVIQIFKNIMEGMLGFLD